MSKSGSHSTNLKTGAQYIANTADAMMDLRQQRAQNHIDLKENILKNKKE